MAIKIAVSLKVPHRIDLIISKQREYFCLCSFIKKKFFFWSFVFLGLHTEVPKLGVESELQLPAYTTATATPDPQFTGMPYT